jgi:hypothetical protein
MLALTSTIASHYYNCCTVDSNSPGNYGYHLILPKEAPTASLLQIKNPEHVRFSFTCKGRVPKKINCLKKEIYARFKVLGGNCEE